MAANPTINIKLVPEGPILTAEQVARMEVAARQLAKRGNFVGQALVKAINGKSEAEKRTVLVMGFSQCYETILVLNMVINSEVPAETVAKRLEECKPNG
jgi:hypothetical protein